MKTITWMDRDYYRLPAIVHQDCAGCAFDPEPCRDLRDRYQCFEEGVTVDKPDQDFIFIPATDEAVAKYVGWRMNGFVPDEDTNAD